MKPIQVWGVTMRVPTLGGLHRRCIVAARTNAEAARLLDCSAKYLKDYGSTTGNAAELNAAMSKPGTVFYHNAGEFLPVLR